MAQTEASQRRDFSDLIWSCVKNRGCDEIAIRYDCGHTLQADVLAPALPRTQEYGAVDLERRRFTQHCIFVLTKDPAATKVQITVPEGRCGHCQEGNRQALICGLLQMDLTEERDRRSTLAPVPRLELPLSCHSFMAAMGQVCKLPENMVPPPLQANGQSSIRLFDVPPLQREEPWSRYDIEEHLRSKIMRYVGGGMCLLLVMLATGVYFIYKQLYQSPVLYTDGNNTSVIDTADSVNITVPILDAELANSTWIESLTVPIYFMLSTTKEGTSFLWSVLISPLSSLAIVFHHGVLRPLYWLAQIPVLNPLLLAIAVSLLVAELSAPQTPDMLVCSLWGDLTSSNFRNCWNAPARSKTFGSMMKRFSGSSSGKKGGKESSKKTETGGHRNQKGDKPEKGGKGDAAGGKTDRPSAGQKESKGSSGGSSSAPACFVCLDRPSRYVLEPCGHRVVCQECAVQLVDAVVRNRSLNDAVNGAHYNSQTGGSCPSCGITVTRAMRFFS